MLASGGKLAGVGWHKTYKDFVKMPPEKPF
jgi:hypothetical protein